MADNQTIAKGNVTISANADQMVKGLNQAEKKTEGFSKAMESRSQAIMTGFGAGIIGGGLAEVVKGLIEPAVQGFKDWVTGADEVMARMDELELKTRNLSLATDKYLSRAAELRGAMVNRESITASLRDELDVAASSAEKLWKNLRDAEKELSRMRNFAGAIGRQVLPIEQQTKLVEEARKSWMEADKVVEGLQKTFDMATGKLVDPKDLAGINKAIADLDDKFEKIGATDFETALIDFQKLRPTIAQLDAFTSAFQRNEQEQQRWLRAMGQTTGNITPFLGIGAALKSIELGLSAIEKHDSPMFAAALEKGSAEAYSLDVQNRFGFDTTDAAATQRELLAETKRNTKAAERAYEELRTLNKQLGEAV